MVNLRLDHIGVQVRELAPAIEIFSTLFGYSQATEPVLNTRHGAEVVFLEKPGSLPVKLFRTVDESRPHPPKLHHLAFQVDDVAQAVETLAGQGARVLNPPAPGEAFDDEPIAFLFAGGLNIELISTERRRGRIQK